MGLLRDHHRKKLLAEPFPEKAESHIASSLPHWDHLDDDQKARLRDLVQIFVGEMHWEGCGGFEMTDAAKYSIAANACLLLIGLDVDGYDNVREVLVYPTTVATPNEPHALYGMIVESGSQPILGEAMPGGPVLLVWDSIERSIRHPDKGHNVVYHEFAHKLDMLTGSTDGMPLISSREQRERWIEVCTAEFDRVQAEFEHDKRGFLDPYAGTNVGEFFAVVTEYFFDLPLQTAHKRPDLYGVLQDFYGQDPAARERAHHAHHRRLHT